MAWEFLVLAVLPSQTLFTSRTHPHQALFANPHTLLQLIALPVFGLDSQNESYGVKSLLKAEGKFSVQPFRVAISPEQPVPSG